MTENDTEATTNYTDAVVSPLDDRNIKVASLCEQPTNVLPLSESHVSTDECLSDTFEEDDAMLDSDYYDSPLEPDSEQDTLLASKTIMDGEVFLSTADFLHTEDTLPTPLPQEKEKVNSVRDVLPIEPIAIKTTFQDTNEFLPTTIP